MLSKINKAIKKIEKLYSISNSSRYIKYLRKAGVTIGEECIIYEPKKTTIDLTRPYLLDIGDNVRITKGVIILTHGYEWSVMRDFYKRPMGGCAGIKLGNNIFIGMNSIILKGVSVGSNVIIGAGSVVTKNIPDNVVVGGNPAKIICSIDELYNKCLSREYQEAKKQYISILKNAQRQPVKEDFYKSYPHLFLNKNNTLNKVVEKQFGSSIENHDISMFSSFEQFSAAIEIEIKAHKQKSESPNH